MKKISVFGMLLVFASSVFAQKDGVKKSAKDSVPEKVEAVEIKVQGNVIENQGDKLVYNAAMDVTSRGMSASDMMAKVPMVEVDMDGNVSMRGNRNVKVLINGRPSGLLSGNLADALKSLSADDIEKIEVMTNPSAKYDAEGSGGVINIVMKNVKLKGNTGNIRAGLGTRSANLGGTLSFQRGKTNYTVMLGGHMWRTWGESIADRENLSAGIWNQMIQKSDFNNWGGGPKLTFSVDHVFNPKNALSVSTSINTNWRSTLTDWDTKIGKKDSALSFLWAQNADRFSTTLGYDFNIDYRRKFDKKDREFGWSAQVSKNVDNSDYTSIRKNQNLSAYRTEKSLNVGENLEISTQLDLTEPLTKKLSLETGLKGIMRFVVSDYHFDTLNYVSQEYFTLNNRNNTFNYYQNVGAGYLQFNYIINENYSLKIGSRLEFTSFGGNIKKPSDTAFSGKPYSNFIPFFNISRKMGKAGFIKFNFTQRIQRPSLFFLNPYTNFSDPLNITTGNPYLAPEISTNYELSFGNYTSFGGFGVNLYHKRLNDAIETYRVVDVNKVYKTTYGNIGQNITSGFDLNVNLKGKNWMLSGNGGLGYVNIRSIIDTGSVAGLSSQGFIYSGGIRGSLNFGKSWMIELFSRFNAPSFSLQGYTANWFFHMIGIKKRFNKDKGGIGFGFDNPLAWQIDYKTENKGKDFTFNEVRRTNMWGFRVNFDYSFGSIESEKIKPVERKLKNDDLKDGENQGGAQ